MKKYATLAVFFRAFFADQQRKPRQIGERQYPELAHCYGDDYCFYRRLVFDGNGQPWLFPIDCALAPWREGKLKKNLRHVSKESLPAPVRDQLHAMHMRWLGYVVVNGRFELPEKKKRRQDKEAKLRAWRETQGS